VIFRIKISNIFNLIGQNLILLQNVIKNNFTATTVKCVKSGERNFIYLWYFSFKGTNQVSLEGTANLLLLSVKRICFYCHTKLLYILTLRKPLKRISSRQYSNIVYVCLKLLEKI